MKEALLSVIVPIYNAEMFLDKCINSIVNQTYKQIEIILINDGSADSSGTICDKFAEKYSNIRVIHQENKGLVESRKIGVKHASGDVIAFVDADDWIEPDMYAEMMDKFVTYKVDVVTTGIIFEYKDRSQSVYDIFSEGKYEQDDIKKRIVPNMMYSELDGSQGVTASFWNKIFRKELLINEMQFINSDITYGEDGAVVYPLIVGCESIYIINKSYYHYVQHDKSMLHTFSKEIYEKIHYLNHYLHQRFIQLGLLEETKGQIAHYVGTFLKIVIEGMYNILMNENFYLFPYEMIPQDSKVIIYGAGVVGKCYYKSLVKSNYAKVVGWIDREEKKVCSIKTEKLETLQDRDYDYIIIALSREDVAESVKDMLINIGVDSKKIVWKIVVVSSW